MLHPNPSSPAIHQTKNILEGFQAGYLTLLESGELEQWVRLARQHLQSCDLCARYCRVDRLRTTQGAVCRTGERAVVYSYGDSETAHRYSHVRNYWEVNQAAVKEMHRQVGNLRLDEKGLAYRGLLIRHLVLPAGLAGTERVLEFIAREISTETYLNLMDRYYPCYRASERPELSHPIATVEYREVLDIARHLGLIRRDHPHGGHLR